jgi:glucose-6-phosphate isomerase
LIGEFSMSDAISWEGFKERFLYDAESGFALDTSRLKYTREYVDSMEPRVTEALDAMDALEQGGIANADENRMVGHYWLRDSSRAPSQSITEEIDSAVKKIKEFAAGVHAGEIRPNEHETFEHILIIGIGGSALGPQFVTQALSSAEDKLSISFFDNTDPDGMGVTLARIPRLSKTLVIVISKSGGTKETRNGQLVAKKAFEAAGLEFARHFIAVTGEGSALDQTAVQEGWLERFPMWDWVGGRTSEFSAVGLLPLALQGFDMEMLLAGGRYMDSLTRVTDIESNPAAMMALAWYHCGCGRGSKDMVVLPYKDRLELFSKYLQQLVMESLGKEFDRDGNRVNQGLAVYGNKGSTDQHAYVQQLREGVHNFFAVFIEVVRDKSSRTVLADLPVTFSPDEIEVEPSVASGDYLAGFFLGTRSALYENERESVSVTISEVNEYNVGMLIALFERAVGIYAELINVNAYHQPGVEAGKKAASDVLALQAELLTYLRTTEEPVTVVQIATALGKPDATETIFRLARHLAANERIATEQGASVFDDRYYVSIQS